MDSIYETFYSNKTMKETNVQRQVNGTYLIDSDGDNKLDYSFDPTTSTLSIYEPLPGFEIVFVLCAIVVVILLWRKKN